MTDWVCAVCRAQVAPGAPRCPECPSTTFEKPEAGMVLKISRDGTVSDSADVAAKPFFDQLADVKASVAEANEEPANHPGTGVPVEGIEHPADGTMSELVSDAPEGAPQAEQVTQLPPGEFAEPEPLVPPRPPRRTPPPGA